MPEGSETGHRGSALARRGLEALLEASLRPPLKPVTLGVLRGSVRRWPGWRVLDSACWHAGDVLGRREAVLKGRLRSGSTMYLLARDYGHRYIYFRGEWEEPTTKFLRSVARPGWTFLDVGANAGYFSLLARDLGGPTSTVHAFEPNPEVGDLLTRSVAEHGDGAVTLVRAAVGDHQGEVEFHVSVDPGNSGLSSLRNDVLGESRRVAVDMVTLDDHCSTNGLVPDVIKIDVEGCEAQVLGGAERLLDTGVVRYVICEFEPIRAPVEPLIALLGEHGYVARAITPTGGLSAEI
nr:FkbM family methyltransferase [Actinomycetota bacterium]